MKGRTQALYVVSDPLFATNRIRIHTLAMSARLPTMHGFREYVEAGGLVSYGASFLHLWRRASEYVDKILRGAKPGDLPVEQPTKFDLVVNLVTAQALERRSPRSGDDQILRLRRHSGYPRQYWRGQSTRSCHQIPVR
jgi:putative tryptophan/tyrosine transport system substrate-binding protein